MVLRYITLLMVVASFISCSKDSEGGGDDAEFNQNREKWKNAKIADYSIQENHSCYCGGLLEWEIIVKNNIKDSLIFDTSLLSENQTYDMVLNNAMSIEEAFDLIENFDADSVFLFEVDYDEKYGFPTRIYN